MDYSDARVRAAVRYFWQTRKKQADAQGFKTGKKDYGSRSAVTGGKQIDGFIRMVAKLLKESELPAESIHIDKKHVVLPGWFRPSKEWDLVALVDGVLLAVIEFKSQVGSFGNNFNNRSEEAIGSATDIWVAYREGRFGKHPAPFLGYFFLLEDCERVKVPVRNKEPYFNVDPAFNGASYSKRYELLARRLVLERVYTAACLVMATNEAHTKITQPAEDLDFKRFVAALRGHAVTFLGSRK